MTLGQVDQEPAPPVPPSQAAQRFTVPPGFHVTLFAGEPDVKQPIAFTFDDRGRLWVCECYSYPKWHKDPKDGKDRIVIFEDTDGDGVFDKRTVFAENLSNLSGIELGFGGVWLCSTPNLLFIPIKPGEDKPSGPAVVKLDGWSLAAQHNVFNSLKWGPDGWLYGCNGITATSKVGAPGTAEKDRVPFNCGVWRYHPTKSKFEVYAWGTTNPWGLDWDEHGEMFITNCVISHLWHVVPGAHFERMYGQDLNPHVYGLLKGCADHLHWGGGNWTTSRGGKGEHSVAGGGHAHVGCMIYQGDNWPERYRGGVFMCNLHGTRINHDVLERNGSTYVARHGKDFAFSSDPWFRGLALDYGPDGGVFVTDWSDTGECHNYDKVHASSGRIFKITYGKPEHKKFDLSSFSDEELVKLQEHKNEWFVRHARRILQERAAEGKLADKTGALVAEWFDKMLKVENNPDEPRAARNASYSLLRLLWLSHSTANLSWKPNIKKKDWGVGEKALMDYREFVRAAGVRLLMQDPEMVRNKIDMLEFLADNDPSPLVRLAIASGLQKVPLSERHGLAGCLVRHDDSLDPYLPLMVWYGVEPFAMRHKVVPVSADALALMSRSQMSLVREFLARRITQYDDAGIPFVLAATNLEKAPSFQRDILRGIQDALKDRRNVSMPKHWNEFFPIFIESPLEEVRDRTISLAVQFGDERALTTMRQILVDDKSTPRLRQNALQTLLLKRPADLVPALHGLLSDPFLRGPALRGLASYDDARTPKLILDQYAGFTSEDKADAVQTLSSRAAYALALLQAVEKKQVPREDLSNFTVRQLRALNEESVTAKLNELWGQVRPAAADKVALIEKYKKLLTPAYLKKADKSQGRAVYLKSCAVCHRLFDDGGNIGPDITGSQRHNLDYLLENILDPSAVVPNEFQVAIVVTTKGRTVTGLVKQETERSVTLQTQNELIILPRDEVDSLKRTKTSMMPDGLLDNLRVEEVRDLIAYLAGPTQVPLPRPAGKK